MHSGAEPPPMPASVSWTYDSTTESWLRWLARAGAAALVGGYLAYFGSGLLGLVAVLLTGDLAIWALVALLLLVGGPFSLLYLAPMLRDPDQRRGLVFSGRERRLPLRETLAAGFVGAIVLAAAALVTPALAGVLFLVGALAGLVAVCFATRGSIDPETATAERGWRELDLSRVTGYGTRRVGPVVLVTFETAGPDRLGAGPSYIVVPTSVADEATAALDAIADADREVETRERNTTVRIVALLFALLFAGGAVGLGWLADAAGWLVAAIGLVFAGIFLVVAREG
jgi:hypothetical protein